MKWYIGVLLCVVLLLSCNVVWCSSPIQDGDPGTIGAALLQQDGTQITLTGEQVVWRGKSGKSFAIKEFYDARSTQPRIVVVSTHALPVKDTYTVDITGTLSTISGTAKDGSPITQRVIITSPDNIYVCCDPNGRPMIYPPVKSLGAAKWLSKKTLTELTSISASNALAMDGGLPPMDDSPDSDPPLPPAAGSRDSLKWLPDGSRVHLRNRLVMGRVRSGFSIEEPDRTSSIRVDSSSYVVNTGNLVDVVGTLTTSYNERLVKADSNGVTVTESNCAIPRPVGMTNKSMGGGAEGPFTPAVGSSVGLNNTGMLARVWGKVTEIDLEYEGRDFCIVDDGSGIDSGFDGLGIRIYGYSGICNVGDNICATGIIGSDYGAVLGASYPVIWSVNYTYPAYTSGSGTISGIITANSSAAGATARIHSTCGTTTCTLDSSGIGTYSLSARAGSHTVSVDVAGYTHAAAKASVTANQTTTKNFTLTSIGKDIYVYTNAPRIAPDGASTTTVIAMVFDEEGRRLENQPITWSVDLGTIVSSDSVTNAVGEAYCVVRSSTNHETATVWAQNGSNAAGCYLEYANESDPYIIITQPIQGEIVNGLADHAISVNNDGGQVTKSVILVDGNPYVPLAATTDNPDAPPCAVNTWRLTNGQHTMQARLTTLAEEGITEVYSNVTQFVVDNPVTLINNKSNMQGSGSTPFIFSGSLKESGNWTLKVIGSNPDDPNAEEPCVFSANGTGSNIDVTWNGTVNGQFTPGVYSIEVWINNQKVENAGAEIGVSDPNPGATVLVAGTFESDGRLLRAATKRCMNAVIKACKRRGKIVRVICDPYWEVRNDSDEDNDSISYNLLHGSFHYLYLTCHGISEQLNNDNVVKPEYLGRHRTYLCPFKCGNYVYGSNLWALDNKQNAITAVSGLCLPVHSLMFTQVDACFSMGDYRTETDNTFAWGFGCRNDEYGCTYLGWNNYNNPLPPWNYQGFTWRFWKYFGDTIHSWSVSECVQKTKQDPIAYGLWRPYLSLYTDYSSMVCWLVP